MKIFIYFFIILSISILSVYTKNSTKEITKTKQFFQTVELDDRSISIEVTRDFVQKAIDELEQARNRREVEIILTTYIDELFKKLAEMLSDKRYNPYPMPDITESFDYMLTSGTIGFRNGNLQGLQTIHRGGAIRFIYDPFRSNLVTIIVPITFDELPFVYDYVAKFMKLGPSGKVRGIISKLAAKVYVEFDVEARRASFKYLRLENSENIEVIFSGYPLMDWLLNLFVNIAARAVRGLILGIIEVIGQKPIQSVVASINDILRDY